MGRASQAPSPCKATMILDPEIQYGWHDASSRIDGLVPFIVHSIV